MHTDRLFTRLALSNLAIAFGEIKTLQGSIAPLEWLDIANANPKRQQEYVAGRRLARKLSSDLSLMDKPLRRSANHLPTWPNDRTGSLSHCDRYCAVAVGKTPHIRSVGIDIETIGRVKPKLWDRLFTKKEQSLLSSLGDLKQAFAATAMFSAKETFYKFQYSYTNGRVGFKDIEVHLIDQKSCRISFTHNLERNQQPNVYIDRVDPEHLATLMVATT